MSEVWLLGKGLYQGGFDPRDTRHYLELCLVVTLGGCSWLNQDRPRFYRVRKGTSELGTEGLRPY